VIDAMVELALPRTDAGVLAQALVVFPLLLVGLVVVWRFPLCCAIPHATS